MQTIYDAKILIVDDNQDLLNLVTTALRSTGYNQLTACTGCAAAQAAFAANRPDLMILDINLPDGDGFSLFRTLHSMADIPALFLSARDADADRLFGLGLGADDYLTKPFLTQELLLRIQRILQRCYRGELWRTAAKTLQLGQRTVYLADALVRLPDGTAQPLTATERALLQKLAENRGHRRGVRSRVGGRLLRVREQPECSHPPPAGKAGTQPQQAAVPFNGAGHRL